jgi:hypothetical protein
MHACSNHYGTRCAVCHTYIDQSERKRGRGKWGERGREGGGEIGEERESGKGCTTYLQSFVVNIGDLA